MDAPQTPTLETATPTDIGGFESAIDSFFSNPEPVAQDPTPEPVVEQTPTSEPVAEPTPEPVAEEPKTDLDSFDDLESVKDWTPQAARRFKELKAELKNFKARSEELEQSLNQRDSRLKELEAISNNPEYKQLQDLVSDYENKMILNNLEQSNAYKVLVDQPLNKLVSEADEIAQKYEVDAASLLDVIASDDEAFQEESLSNILANATDRDKFRVYKIIEEVKPILQQRRILHENAQAALAEAQALDEQKNQQALVQRAEGRKEAARVVAEKLSSKLPFLNGLDSGTMQSIANEAAAIEPSNLDPVTGAYQAIAAKLLPKMAAQYLSLQKEVDTLTSQLADYDRAAPKAGGGSVPTISQSIVSDSKSFVDAVTAAFGG